MTVINDFINNLIDQHEIFPNALLIQNSAIVSKHLHHPVQYVHHKRGRDVVLGSRYKEYAKLLGIEKVDSLHALQ